MKNEFKKLEVFHNDGWIEISIESLKKDDIFHMYGNNGEPVNGGEEYRATRFALPIHDSWMIWAEPANGPQLYNLTEADV